MRVLRSLTHAQDRRITHVAVFHDRVPLGTSLGEKHSSQLFFEHRPLGAIHLGSEFTVTRETRLFQQQRVELRLNRTNRHPLAVGTLEHVIEVRTSVEQVGAARVLIKHADVLERPEHAHQHRRTIDHRRINDLTLARTLGFEQRAHHAVGEQHSPATKVAHHVERWCRRFTGATEMRECAGERDVVDVVPGRVRVWALLAPAGHASEHQPWVAREALTRANTETLHDARSKAFDDGISALDELQERGGTIGVFEVKCDIAAAA